MVKPNLFLFITILFSEIYQSSCHLLLGPVSKKRIASLTIKILQFAAQRLTSTDFRQLLGALQRLEKEDSWKCVQTKGESDNFRCDCGSSGEGANHQIAEELAHAMRLQPELLGLFCSILPADISQSPPLRESNQSLRAGKYILN